MTGNPVRVNAMRLDPAYTKTPGRARYRITLTCSCSWWEDYPVGAVPSRVGDLAVCYDPKHAEIGGEAPREAAYAAGHSR